MASTKLVLVEVREVIYNYHTVVMEVPDEVGVTDERIKKFAEQHFAEHMEMFTCDDSEQQDYDCTEVKPIEEDRREAVQKYRMHDEGSITSSCMFQRWHDETPLVEVDPDKLLFTGYLGDGIRGVYYRIKEIGTFFYASALIVTPEGNAKYLFTDRESGSELRLVDYCQDEAGHWCSENDVEDTPTSFPPIVEKRPALDKSGFEGMSAHVGQ